MAFGALTPAVPLPGCRICTLAIDAEEDFDWDSPIRGTSNSTSHMRNVRVLETILGAYGIVPTYLLTFPVLEDADVVRIIRRQLDRGTCAVGIQLHPWVTPPFNEAPSHRVSFPGNLDTDLEERKLIALKAKFIECFGHAPTAYRAGRYGLGEHTPLLLEKHGFAIDTSIAPRTSFTAEGGPDHTGYDCNLFWFGKERRLLEVPLCRSIVGWAGQYAPMLYRALARSSSPSGLLSILARLRCAERITFSPEGNDVPAMRRLARGLVARNQAVLALSFHSSSLQVGRNPYVQSKAELHAFYDRLSAILDHLASGLSFRFAGLAQLPDFLAQPGPPAPCPPAQ